MSEVRPPTRSGAVVALAMIGMSALTYAFNLIAARGLIPAEFGALTALLSIILIANVVSLGIQAAVARNLAIHATEHSLIIATTARLAWVAALSVGAVVALSTFALTPALHLDTHAPVVLAGLMMVPLTLMGALAGIAQGTERWRFLAGLYLGNGLGRIVGGTLGMLLFPTATGAMFGLAIGAWLPVIMGWKLSRSTDAARASVRRPLIRESCASSLALVAYFCLSNMDALLARSLFSGYESGLYAAGLIVTKSALFLPQFVSVVFFPRLARDAGHRSRLLAVGLVATLGASAVIAVAGLPHLALHLAGGDAYRAIATHLWLFALSGTVLAIVYLLVFDAIASQLRGTAIVLWAAVVVIVAVAHAMTVDVFALVTLMSIVGTCTAVVLFFLPWWTRQARESATLRSHGPSSGT